MEATIGSLEGLLTQSGMMKGGSGTALNGLHETDEFKIDEKQVSHAFYLTEPPVQVFNTGDATEGYGPFSQNAMQSPLQIYTNYKKTPFSQSSQGTVHLAPTGL